ncbi:MAG: SDR family oxidoreductase [Ardenticatenaceae bacterium]|nr:SDR family oxidoreductase [Ardenticatenaceae bacterium]MCB9443859.1 SDR family oxidoreductase [Ardenticatenaceae bacterium]
MMEIKDEYHAIMPRYPELEGQVAVITGGAKGIGQGIALRLGREGMRLVIADIDGESLAATAASLRELGVQVIAFEGDLSQSTIIIQLFKTVLETFNRVDLLVNNAADLNRTRLLDEHEALLEQQLATNVSGPYLCSFQAAKIMRDTGSGGNIIHISSVGAIRAHWNGFPYDVTKGAINAMTRAMAIDLAEYNIRVNAIGPGATRTYRTGLGGNTAVQSMAERIPLKRFGLVSEMSSVVAFLASPEASYITGQIIYVDGGITAQLSPPGQML